MNIDRIRQAMLKRAAELAGVDSIDSVASSKIESGQLKQNPDGSYSPVQDWTFDRGSGRIKYKGNEWLGTPNMPVQEYGKLSGRVSSLSDKMALAKHYNEYKARLQTGSSQPAAEAAQPQGAVGSRQLIQAADSQTASTTIAPYSITAPEAAEFE